MSAHTKPSALVYGAGALLILVVFAVAAAWIFKREADRFDAMVIDQSRARVAIMRAQMDATLDKIQVTLNSVEVNFRQQLHERGSVNPGKMNSLLAAQKQVVR